MVSTRFDISAKIDLQRSQSCKQLDFGSVILTAQLTCAIHMPIFMSVDPCCRSRSHVFRIRLKVPVPRFFKA